ncbi:MAG: imidazole glycerol phosphate synthase subunit HisH [Clostridiales bacterium]|nr:imidazole glycerol phosphate synthase subunit HisH [Clostridiales bacterium]
MVAIIDYDAGNIKSVEKAMQLLGQEVKITRDRDEIMSADHVILPGVGAFGDAMEKLHQYGLVEVIHEVTKKGTPFLGICLGLQLLFEASEEDPGESGLGIFKGRCVKIPPADGIKIPHIGWNSITFPNPSPLFRGIDEGSFVYFVHSYYMKPEDKSIITAVCDYSKELPVALSRGNVHATQFHPEKSGKVGLDILKNFIAIGGDK